VDIDPLFGVVDLGHETVAAAALLRREVGSKMI
jgi:hypothetical protein